MNGSLFLLCGERCGWLLWVVVLVDVEPNVVPVTVHLELLGSRSGRRERGSNHCWFVCCGWGEFVSGFVV